MIKMVRGVSLKPRRVTDITVMDPVGKNSIYFMHYIRILVKIIRGINLKKNIADRNYVSGF